MSGRYPDKAAGGTSQMYFEGFEDFGHFGDPSLTEPMEQYSDDLMDFRARELDEDEAAGEYDTDDDTDDDTSDSTLLMGEDDRYEEALFGADC